MVEGWSALELPSAGVAELVVANQLPGRHELQLRNDFVARDDGGDIPLGIALLRRGGREAVALRLFVLVAWLASAVSVRSPASPVVGSIVALADAVGMTGTDVNRRRRVREALRHVESLGRIATAEPRRGEFEIRVVSDGFPRPDTSYLKPGLASTMSPSRADAYFALPHHLITEGWAGAMTGRALIVLFALQYLKQTLKQADRLFVSESLRERRFGFGEEVYYRGAAELVAYGALSTDRAGIRSRKYAERARTTFQVAPDARSWHPAWPKGVRTSLDD